MNAAFPDNCTGTQVLKLDVATTLRNHTRTDKLMRHCLFFLSLYFAQLQSTLPLHVFVLALFLCQLACFLSIPLGESIALYFLLISPDSSGYAFVDNNLASNLAMVIRPTKMHVISRWCDLFFTTIFLLMERQLHLANFVAKTF